MSIRSILANFVVCYVMFYMSIVIFRGLFHVLFYLVAIREKRMRKIDSNRDSIELNQSPKNVHFHKQFVHICIR